MRIARELGAASSKVGVAAHEVVKDTDAMTRYPGASAGGVMRLLDYFGTAVFAASGAVTAGEAGLDSFGSSFVGCVTALGGGSIRDLLLGKQAFWLAEAEYSLIAASSAVLAFYGWPRFGPTGDSFSMFAADSLSLGAFTTMYVSVLFIVFIHTQALSK